MLEPIFKQDGSDSGFKKHKDRMPRDPTVDHNILAIQINLEGKSSGENDSDLAKKLHECLKVIDVDVLIELKKLLPDS